MMNLETQRAVEESVRHYNRILARVPGEAPVAEQCSLCAMFPRCELHTVDDGERLKAAGCFDASLRNLCPINERTGLAGCEKTPWEDASNAYATMMSERRPVYTRAEKKAIRRELNWLRSFLPTLQMVPYV